MVKTHNPKIILALDYDNQAEALAMASQLSPDLCRLKVGKELFTVGGPALVESLQKLGFEIFLDVKFHDIPNTVAGAVKAAANLGVWMVNVHASGGERMLAAAAQALQSFKKAPLLTAVTVLTSMSENELHQLGVERSLSEQVLFYAQLAKQSGLDGVVCSAQEAKMLRQKIEAPFCLVTPGIRPSGSATDDQQRIVTPQQALEWGSDYLVMGRPIRNHPDPVAALKEINAQVL